MYLDIIFDRNSLLGETLAAAGEWDTRDTLARAAADALAGHYDRLDHLTIGVNWITGNRFGTRPYTVKAVRENGDPEPADALAAWDDLNAALTDAIRAQIKKGPAAA